LQINHDYTSKTCFKKKKKYPKKTLLEKLKFQKTANMIITTTPNKPYRLSTVPCKSQAMSGASIV
jgi:hypothetical protein